MIMTRLPPTSVLRPPDGLLARIRWAFLLFSFFFFVTFLPQVTVQSPLPVPWRLVAAVAVLGLGAWWLRCYRRGTFPVAGLPVEAAGFLACGLAADQPFKALGLLYIAVNFRALYDSGRKTLLFTAVALGCFLTNILVSPLLGGPDQLTQFLTTAPGVPVLALITYLMGRAMARGERATARERALAVASTALAAARDRAEVEAVTTRAALALLGDPPGARASLRTDGPGAPPHVAVPLVVPGEPPAQLVVQVASAGDAARLREEAGDVLEALAGAAALVLANIALTESLRVRAEHDGLTGLLNRTELRERLAAAVRRRNEGGPGHLAVLLIDLDGFKTVNDTTGHAGGDVVLRSAAARLRGHVRAGDVVARLGGDEFAVVLERALDAQLDLDELARRLLVALADPVDVGGGRSARVTASIGVARWAGEKDVDELVDRADRAMYAAKRAGKGCVHEDATAPLMAGVTRE